MGNSFENALMGSLLDETETRSGLRQQLPTFLLLIKKILRIKTFKKNILLTSW